MALLPGFLKKTQCKQAIKWLHIALKQTGMLSHVPLRNDQIKAGND